MKLRVYEHLLALNAGFDQVRRTMRALGRHRSFNSSELARFRDMSEEARAAVMSYLARTIEAAETDAAGRRFRKRVARERQER